MGMSANFLYIGTSHLGISPWVAFQVSASGRPRANHN